MNKNLKSWLNCLIVILIFFYATAGIVKLFWNTKDEYIFETRVKFLLLLLFTASIFYVIGIYHIVGPAQVVLFYNVYIFIAFGYLGVGIISNLFLKNKQ